jgi:hypothetical protein
MALELRGMYFVMYNMIGTTARRQNFSQTSA